MKAKELLDLMEADNQSKFIAKYVKQLNPKKDEVKDVESVLRSIWGGMKTIIVAKKIEQYFNEFIKIDSKEGGDASFVLGRK